MKMIDEKGRLFGKINIIDLCVLVVFLLVIGVAGYKVAGNKLGNVLGTNAETKTVLFTVRCTVRSEALAKVIQPKDQLISLTSKVDAFVESVSYTAADVWVPTADGRLIVTKDPMRKDVLVTVKMKANPNVAIIKLGSQDVAVGSAFFVKTSRVAFGGTIDSLIFQ